MKGEGWTGTYRADVMGDEWGDRLLQGLRLLTPVAAQTAWGETHLASHRSNTTV